MHVTNYRQCLQFRIVFYGAVFWIAIAGGGMAARAEQGVLFLDGSASVKSFAEVYRTTMREIASAARSSSGNRIDFVRIGDVANGARLDAANSNMNDLDLSRKLQRPFSFKDKFTRISNSMSVAQGLSKDATQIMIVTDLEPDHKAAGGKWAFSVQDMQDLLETHKRLKKLLSSPKLKKMGIVLLDWNQQPEGMLSSRQKRNPLAFLRRTKSKLIRRLGGSAGAGKEDSSNQKLYQQAAAAVVYDLKASSPDKLEITLMPKSVNGQRNERQFFNSACKVFVDALREDPRCDLTAVSSCRPAQQSALKTDFNVHFVLGRFIRDGTLKSLLKNSFDGEQQIAGLATSRQFSTQLTRTESNPASDYSIEVCTVKSSLVQQNGRTVRRFQCVRSRRMNLRKLGWKVSRRNRDGSSEVISGLRAVNQGGGRQQDDVARRSFVKDVMGVLRRDIRDNHRPKPVSVRIYLHRGTADGPVLPQGHWVSAHYTIGNSQDKTNARIDEGTGGVTLKIPSGATDIKLVHSARLPEGDVDTPMGDVPQSVLSSCEYYHHPVPEAVFVEKSLVIKWPAVTSVERVGRLSIRMTDGAYRQIAGNPPVISGDAERALTLLPGRYTIRFAIDDPRYQSVVLTARPWKHDSTLQSGLVQTVELPVKSDPLALEITNENNARQNLDQIPNYLAAPQKLWDALKELVSDDGELTVAGKDMMASSQNYFWGLLSLVAIKLEEPETRLPNGMTQESLLKHVKAARDYFRSSAQDEQVVSSFSRGLRRVGLIDIDGKLLPRAPQMLQVLLDNIVDNGGFCSQRTSTAVWLNKFGERLITNYNSWLEQSSIEKRFQAQRPGQVQIGAQNARRASHSPFTEALVTKCLIGVAG